MLSVFGYAFLAGFIAGTLEVSAALTFELQRRRSGDR